MEGVLVKIIFGGSLIGMGAIIFRKIPVLVEIPEESIQDRDFKGIFLKSLSKIIKFQISLFYSVLRKILSGIKALTMTVHRKTDSRLKKLKKSAIDKNGIKDDKYWKELKKLRDDKD